MKNRMSPEGKDLTYRLISRARDLFFHLDLGFNHREPDLLPDYWCKLFRKQVTKGWDKKTQKEVARLFSIIIEDSHKKAQEKFNREWAEAFSIIRKEAQ